MKDWRFFVRKTSLVWENIAHLEEAEKIVLGVPFDSTSTGLPGSRLGPSRIREEFRLWASSYHPGLGELESTNVFDAGDVEVVPGDVRASLDRVYTVVSGIINENPNAKLILLGGEHSITYPVVKALRDKDKDFDYLCFDAHFDLLDSYLGLKESHASVNRRISELLGLGSMEVVGARTGEKEEWDLSKKLGKAKPPVYLSVDVDVFEGVPTGTPVPGGLGFSDVWKRIEGVVKSKDWVAADIVEYNPMVGSSPIPSELLRRLLF